MTRKGQSLSLIAALVFGVLFTSAGALRAEDGKATQFGIKAGFFSPGTVYPETGGELSGSLGMSVGGFVDHMLSPKMSGGAHLEHRRCGRGQILRSAQNDILGRAHLHPPRRA